jgi:hypothetical protein
MDNSAAEGIVRIGGTGALTDVRAARERPQRTVQGVASGSSEGRDAGSARERATSARRSMKPVSRAKASEAAARRDAADLVVERPAGVPAQERACEEAAADPRLLAARQGSERVQGHATLRRTLLSSPVPVATDKAEGASEAAGRAPESGDEADAERSVDASLPGGARGVDRIAGHTTRLRQLRFARVLAETCNVAAAAASAGRTLATVHRWRSVDAAFAAAWDEALAMGYDRLENALLVYAIGKVDAVAAGAAGASISNGDLQLAVGMLQRHRTADGGRRGQMPPVRMPTEAESDAALRRALDGLARRGAAS